VAQKVSHYHIIKNRTKPAVRLDFFVKLKYQSSTIISSVGRKFQCVTYFLTSLTMLDL